MATDTLLPDEDVTVQANWTTAPYWSKIDEDTAAPNDADFIRGSALFPAGATSVCGFATRAVSAVTQVVLHCRARNGAAGNVGAAVAEIFSSTGVGQQQLNFIASGLNGSFANYQATLSGISWTQTDLDNMRVSFRVAGDGGDSQVLDISACKAVITYTEAASAVPQRTLTGAGL